MQKLIPTQIEQGFQAAFLLLVRLYWGWQFAQAGLGKLKNIAQPIGFFTNLGIPLPQLSAYMVASIELVGGVLLVLGLFARPAAAALVAVMLGAYYFADFDALLSFYSDPSTFIAATPFSFLFAALVVFFFGAGWASVDAFLFKRRP